MSDFDKGAVVRSHYHYYRPSVAGWWCGDCGTTTEHCRQVGLSA